MSLVSIREAITQAQAGGYALPLFNTFDQASAEGILAALAQGRSPAMLGVYSGLLDKPDARAFVACVRTLAEDAATPVALMLDHGQRVDQCLRALEWGFTDVMYDGAKLPLEENIANTQQVVQAARAVGAAVEAELGVVGLGSEYDTFGGARQGFTDPAVAERFAAETGCDILAVAIGNAHGVYKGQPHIDCELLGQIRQRLTVPLSLHGGSGLSDDQFRQAVAGGICKVNIFTDLSLAAGERLRQVVPDSRKIYFDALDAIRTGFRDRCLHYIDVFGSGGKA